MKTNPFLLSGYKSPEYFCDRDLETGRLIDSINNQRNLSLISARRMGKTGLLRHTFQQLSGDRKHLPVYFDILGTTSLGEFTEVFSNALLRTISGSPSAVKGLIKRLALVRPVLSFDPLSGERRISLDLSKEGDTERSIEGLFHLIAENKHLKVLAIDEFQQIATYPEKNMEALLRSHVQQCSNLSFIFSGSKKHMLSAMFSQPSRPFFNSAEMMFLEPIKKEVYFPFIRKRFKNHGKTISDNALVSIAEHTSMHTFYVQFLCNRLFSQFKKVKSGDVDRTLYSILLENEPVYAGYLNLLTRTQFRVLRAIAQDKSVDKPTSGDFLARHSLGAASSVLQAIGSLASREMIHNEPENISLQDKFLAAWIRLKNA